MISARKLNPAYLNKRSTRSTDLYTRLEIIKEIERFLLDRLYDTMKINPPEQRDAELGRLMIQGCSRIDNVNKEYIARWPNEKNKIRLLWLA